MPSDQLLDAFTYERPIFEIRQMKWTTLSPSELLTVAWAYYFFSVQFRENLEIACDLHPDDPKLRQLRTEECHTDNLSPWPGVASAGEKMDHDEFMRRLLTLAPVDDQTRRRFEAMGARYLEEVRAVDPFARALSIASYEDGGLETVFGAMLTAPSWEGPALQAFRHFLAEHIRFDSDPEAGHGALSQHLRPDDRILPLWTGFRDLLLAFTPALDD